MAPIRRNTFGTYPTNTSEPKITTPEIFDKSLVFRQNAKMCHITTDMTGAYLFLRSYANVYPMPQICVCLACHRNFTTFREISTKRADLDLYRYLDHEFSQTSRLVELKLHTSISTLTGIHPNLTIGSRTVSTCLRAVYRQPWFPRKWLVETVR